MPESSKTGFEERLSVLIMKRFPQLTGRDTANIRNTIASAHRQDVIRELRELLELDNSYGGNLRQRVVDRLTALKESL